jgi:TolA-binding protein
MRALTFAILAGLIAAAPAAAQVERLPEQSRAERQVENLNRSMQLQQMQTRQSQQTQFEINQLRGEIQRSQQFPRMTGPCVPGAVC